MRAMFRRIELKMKRYISIILGILTSLSISAANFPAEGFSGDGYGDFNVEDYGSDEVGADYGVDDLPEPEYFSITVNLPSGGTEDIEVMAWSNHAYAAGDVLTGTSFGTLTLSATGIFDSAEGEITISYPGYLFAVDNNGKIVSEGSLGGGGLIFKMPLEENLAVALMLIMMAAAYGVFRLRKKRANLA